MGLGFMVKLQWTEDGTMAVSSVNGKARWGGVEWRDEDSRTVEGVC